MPVMESQGVVLKIGDGGATEIFNAIGRVTGISGLGGGSAAEIETTDLSSIAKEFLLGLADEGEVSLTLNLDTSDTYQTQLRNDRASRVLRNFELDLTDAGPTTLSFSAFVKTFQIGISLDDKITLEVSLRISGAVTWE